MDIELPPAITADTIQRAGPAVAALRTMLTEDGAAGGLRGDLTLDALEALLAVMDGVSEAAADDQSDITPSEAAQRLRMARPSVMRLIARGDLSSRKEGGHYVVSPRELRSFQARLAGARREAFAALKRLAGEI